jgi:hypothetical protein
MLRYGRSKLGSRNDSGAGPTHFGITPWRRTTRELVPRAASTTRSSDIDRVRARIASPGTRHLIQSIAPQHGGGGSITPL